MGLIYLWRIVKIRTLKFVSIKTVCLAYFLFESLMHTGIGNRILFWTLVFFSALCSTFTRVWGLEVVLVMKLGRQMEMTMKSTGLCLTLPSSSLSLSFYLLLFRVRFFIFIFIYILRKSWKNSFTLKCNAFLVSVVFSSHFRPILLRILFLHCINRYLFVYFTREWACATGYYNRWNWNLFKD